MPTWLQPYESVLWWLAALSVVTFIGTLMVIPVLVVRIPADYFVRPRDRATPELSARALWRLVGLILKNGVGLVFVLAGLAMLVLPGQGLLSIIIGLSLMNFPGKRALETRLVRQPAVHRTINWMRAKAGRPPLEVPAPPTVETTPGPC